MTVSQRSGRPAPAKECPARPRRMTVKKIPYLISQDNVRGFQANCQSWLRNTNRTSFPNASLGVLSGSHVDCSDHFQS